jgi:hypothetical protein
MAGAIGSGKRLLALIPGNVNDLFTCRIARAGRQGDRDGQALGHLTAGSGTRLVSADYGLVNAVRSLRRRKSLQIGVPMSGQLSSTRMAQIAEQVGPADLVGQARAYSPWPGFSVVLARPLARVG